MAYGFAGWRLILKVWQHEDPLVAMALTACVLYFLGCQIQEKYEGYEEERKR
jgi:hypothetical protein